MVSGQRHAPAALYLRGKDPRYPLDRRLGGLHSRSGRRGWKKNPLPLSGIEPRSSSPWLDTILTELPRLVIIIIIIIIIIIMPTYTVIAAFFCLII
jgi:hypothetical protein